ncbi:MAG: hypothetical protein C6I00_02370 [Nitratiruptor sp.]|nr:hypothetical protein [Nitratiruptor sp.]NPA84131.1 lytic transglycosylase domain-containing protein [Campylobacterota bacterium]
MRGLWLLGLWLLAQGKEIDLHWLEGQPTSRAKDYYIWRYLQQPVTPSQARAALQQAQRVTPKLLEAYAKRADPATKRVLRCWKLPAKRLLEVEPSCAAAGVSVAKLSQLPKGAIATLMDRLAAYQLPQEAQLLLRSHLSPKEFLALFNAAAPSYRKRMDRYFKGAQLATMAKEKWAFKALVRTVVFSKDYPKLATSLLLTPPELLDARSAFFLAMQALKSNLPNTAIDYLHHAARKGYYQEHIDQANFWLYRLTGDRRYRQKLLDSWDLNIYTILAREEAKLPIPYTIFEAKGTKELNLSDPFVWHAILTNPSLKKEEFFYENTLAVYAYLAQREANYRLHPFILPYKEELSGLSNHRRALIYAIARQESHFIPGAISHSFALGLMQFMPFLARHVAKELQVEGFDLDMMFEPAIALRFARHHLDFLEPRLQANPLFVAYAYNGGIGFTRRKVLPLFQKYDPLLAMELVPYGESREYGKRVLANYYVYRKILKAPFNLADFFQTLAVRSRSPDAKSAR